MNRTLHRLIGALCVVALMSAYATGCEAGEPDIHDAARNGDVARVKELLEREPGLVNARANPWKETPLHCAVDHRHREVVELLIAKGADVNAEDISRQTPLHEAAIRGHEEMVRLLLAHGADANAANQWGHTPANSALLFDYDKIAELLCQHGAQ